MKKIYNVNQGNLNYENINIAISQLVISQFIIAMAYHGIHSRENVSQNLSMRSLKTLDGLIAAAALEGSTL